MTARELLQEARNAINAMRGGPGIISTVAEFDETFAQEGLEACFEEPQRREP